MFEETRAKYEPGLGFFPKASSPKQAAKGNMFLYFYISYFSALFIFVVGFFSIKLLLWFKAGCL